MKIYLKRRVFVRTIVFFTCVPLLIIGFMIQTVQETAYYRRTLENSYARSLGELSSYLTNIASDMEKAKYIASPERQSQMAARVWRESGGAKAALSQLPVGELHLDGTYKFLSQAGDYAMALSRKAAMGGEISADERKAAAQLSDYAGKLRDYVDGLQRTGGIDLRVSVEEEGNAIAVQGLQGGFEDIEQTMQGYPTLIYDGPFSDHLLNRKPLLLENARAYSAQEARQVAAAAMRQAPAELERQDDENSDIPAYVFAGNDVTVSVSKRGGYVGYLISAREIGEERLARDNVYARAQKFLDDMGIQNMKATYYEQADGIFTINYAAQQDGVTLYPDLVKVGVALDDGSIVYYDARGYLMNHHERVLPAAVLTMQQASEKVSDALRIGNAKRALIPTSGQNEALTYEFSCIAKDDKKRQVLVYINALTGEEENILLLIETPLGVLTK